MSARPFLHGPDILPVGLPNRQRMGRAIVASLATGAVFVLFDLLSVQDKAVQFHSPWDNDPFDSFMTFGAIFVPILMIALLGRTQLCRAAQPLPVRRVADLLRAGKLLLVFTFIIASADWVAVITRQRSTSWGLSTAVLIACLGLLSLCVGVAAVVMRRASTVPELSNVSSNGPDWLDDALEVAHWRVELLGPLAPAATRLIDAVDGEFFAQSPRGLRRYPLRWAVGVSLVWGIVTAFGLTIGENAVADGRYIILASSVTGGSMFGFLVLGGRYLRFLRPQQKPPHPVLLVSLLCSAVSVPVTVAFRGNLSWIVTGVFGSASGTGRLLILIILVAATVGVVSLLAQVFWKAATKRRGGHGSRH